MDLMDKPKDLTMILQSLMNYVSKDQLRQLKLTFSLAHLAHGYDIEKSTSLLEFKNLLLCKPKSKAIPMIQSILMIIEVNKAETKKLCSWTTPSDLQDCEKILCYPRIIVECCKGLKAEEFESIKVALCEDVLDCSADTIENCEDLCLKLHQQQKISDKKLDVLAKFLRNVGRYDIEKKLLDFTEDFKYSIEVTQPKDGEQTTSLQLKEATNHPSIPKSIRLSKTVCASSIVQPASSSISAEQSTNSLRPSTQQGTDHIYSRIQETQNELQVPETNSRNDDQQDQRAAMSQHAHMQDVPSNQAETQPFSSSIIIDQAVSTHNTGDILLDYTPQQETGNGSSQLSLDTKRSQQISSVPVLRYKQSQTPCGFTKFMFSAFPFLRFIFFTLIVTVYLRPRISDQLVHIDDAVILTEGGDSIADFLRSYIISTNGNNRGDKSLHISVFNVSTSDLKYNTKIIQNSTETAEELQLQSSCKTGLVGTDPYMYLLSSSFIHYEICLKLVFIEDTFNGQLYIFDSEETLQDYLNDDDCNGHGAIQSHNLLLGSDHGYRCTQVELKTIKNGYYFITSKTPANISYFYKYSIKKRFLNPTKLATLKCTINVNSVSAYTLDTLYKQSLVIYVHPEDGKAEATRVSLSSYFSVSNHFSEFDIHTVWMLLSYVECLFLVHFTHCL